MSFIDFFTVINGTHPTLRADPYSPGAVLRALHALGWVIPPDEHDAHELLHVMLTSLEEEAIRPKKVSFKVRSRFFTFIFKQFYRFLLDWMSIGCTW